MNVTNIYLAINLAYKLVENEIKFKIMFCYYIYT